MRLQPPTVRQLLLVIALLGTTALAACGGGDEPASTPAPAVASATPTATAVAKAPSSGVVNAAIEGFAFAPADIGVKVGEKITWTNRDSAAHTVTARSGAQLDSGTMAQGASFSFTPEEAGTIEYFCSIHPSMTATITVQ
jgi:plastocyanin